MSATAYVHLYGSLRTSTVSNAAAGPLEADLETPLPLLKVIEDLGISRIRLIGDGQPQAGSAADNRQSRRSRRAVSRWNIPSLRIGRITGSRVPPRAGLTRIAVDVVLVKPLF